jgi:hypothetical protein
MNANEASREQESREQRAAKLFSEYIAAKEYCADVSVIIRSNIDCGFMHLAHLVGATEELFKRNKYFPESLFHHLSPLDKAELTSSIEEYLTENGYYITNGYYVLEGEYKGMWIEALARDKCVLWGASAAFNKAEDEKAAAAKIKKQKLKSTYKEKLIEFYRKNSSILLSPEEVLKTATKLFTTSDFAHHNKDKIIELCHRENIIFAFPEGIIVTPEKFHVFNIEIGATRVASFPIDDFLQLKATHSLLFASPGRMTINGREVKKEGFNKFNIDLYEELKLKLSRI